MVGGKGFNRKRILPALAVAGAIAAGVGAGYTTGKRVGGKQAASQVAGLQRDHDRLIRALNAPPSKASVQRSFDAMGAFEAEHDLNGLRDYIRSRASLHVNKANELARRRRWSDADVLVAHRTMSAIDEILPQVGQLREDEVHSALGAAHGKLVGRLSALGRLER